MDTNQRKQFILNVCIPTEVKRRSVNANINRKNKTYIYRLTDNNSKCFDVCKWFFLTTLGFKKNNDKVVVYNVLNKTSPGNIIPELVKRGHEPHNKYKFNDLINEHIESFHPTISHYRREHAPNVRYLPSDVNIVMMHQDFLIKHPNQNISYELYRCKLKEKKISFTNLGNEECEQCEQFKLHEHNKNSIQEDCETCITWKKHETKYTDARNLYKIHSSQKDNINYCVTVSADLQKVIMLPRAEMFKKVIFTRRIIAYHESFVPVGCNSNIKPLVCIWHEGTTGRNKEDIISTFYAFIKKQRDISTLQIWLDNCASQNKNWCLLTFLVYIVNSCEVLTNIIKIYYFEPGHTYMSADSFHHQVELALKKQKKDI
uniref:DUF7869 domain-containing protein n=1 Tax=Schizaphis graminum TaxID=13262 RepID=A0A2S2NS37_SCHGA